MFRFTIRDVLWLMVVIGLALGWVVDHRRLQPGWDRGERWKGRAEYLALALGELGWKVQFGEGRLGGYISMGYKDGRPFPWDVGDGPDWSAVWPPGEPLPAVTPWPPPEEGRDDPVPAKNKVAMTPGMTITATTPEGTIAITAGKGLKRSFTWEGETRSVHMWPRSKFYEGSLGLHFPGSGEHWKEHNGITRAVVEEGQERFATMAEALRWIDEKKSAMQYVYRKDGLIVGWSKTPERNQLNVEVWQIYVDKEKPRDLPGSQDDKVAVKIPQE